MTTLIAALLIAYLVGSFPTGVVLASYFTEIDIRGHGSGNIGATNVFRLTGRLLGALTLVGDALKGALMVIMAEHLFGDDAVTQVTLVALAAFLGHCYSIYLNFKGGKGVATAAGICLVVAPLAGILAASLWVVTVLRWKRSSVGALVGAVALPIFVEALPWYRAWIWLSLALVGVVVWRHKENIDRLVEGKEPATTSLPTEPS